MNNSQLLNHLTQQAVEARRIVLGERLTQHFRGAIAYGLFKGLRLNEKQVWGPGDLAPKLLGLYEKEVLESIASGRGRWDCGINLGAGDGYYGVGLLRSGMVQRSICFEQNAEGQAAIKVCAEANGMVDHISILGQAEANFLDLPELQQVNLARCLIVIDIEGAEFALLSAGLLDRLRPAEIIIELHGGFFPKDPNIEARLLNLLQERFDCELLTMGTRDLSGIPEVARFNDSDRWLLCSEGRPFQMRWVHCRPRQAEI